MTITHVVTLQIHPSDASDFQADLDAAISFIDLAQSNPLNANTRFILYGAWPQTPGDYSDNYFADIGPIDSDTRTSHTDAYQHALFNSLSLARADTKIELLQTGKLLAIADEAIKQQVLLGEDWFGFTDIDQLYRDQVHLSFDNGRWLASLAMWSAVTQQDPADSDWLTGSSIEDETLRLDFAQFVSDNMYEIHTVPEPSSIGLLAIGGFLLARRRR